MEANSVWPEPTMVAQERGTKNWARAGKGKGRVSRRKGEGRRRRY